MRELMIRSLGNNVVDIIIGEMIGCRKVCFAKPSTLFNSAKPPIVSRLNVAAAPHAGKPTLG